MTNTCGNCKFWSQEEITVDVAGFEDYGDCSNPKVVDDTDFAGISEGGCDYPNSFGKNFGCIHFTAKEEVPTFNLWVKRD